MPSASQPGAWHRPRSRRPAGRRRFFVVSNAGALPRYLLRAGSESQWLKAIADALGVSSEKLYQAAGWIEPGDADTQGVESAIRTDARLSSPQKEALIAVYRRFIEEEK